MKSSILQYSYLVINFNMSNSLNIHWKKCWRILNIFHYQTACRCRQEERRSSIRSSDCVALFFGRRHFAPYRWQRLRSSPVLVLVQWDLGPSCQHSATALNLREENNDYYILMVNYDVISLVDCSIDIYRKFMNCLHDHAEIQ